MQKLPPESGYVGPMFAYVCLYHVHGVWLQGAIAEVIRKYKEEIAETEGVECENSAPTEEANGGSVAIR